MSIQVALPVSSPKLFTLPLGRAFLALLVFCCVAMPAQAQAAYRLFGSDEVESRDLRIFEKWTSVLARDRQQRPLMERSCQGGMCMGEQWRLMIDHASRLSPDARLDYVNREINRSPYTIDPQNWNLNDYWETPYEFFTRSGDCEDYAITKYLTLKAAGVPPETMRIVVLQDNNLHLLHSILAVEQQGHIYILDNQLQQVVEDRAIHHYAPIYSINEFAWWRHSQ